MRCFQNMNHVFAVVFVVVFVVVLTASPAFGQNWIKKSIASQGYKLSLEFYSNPGNKGDNTVTAPLYIFSDGKKQGKGSGLLGTHCPSGQWWEISNAYCYSCPTGFNQNVAVGTFGWNKCVKTYKSARAYDSIYTLALLQSMVSKGLFTPRQRDCITSGSECYMGIMGTTGAERYGWRCGWTYGGGRETPREKQALLDNVDKCCWAHDGNKWKKNLKKDETNKDCSNSMNFLRCLWKAKDKPGYNAEAKYAAERIISAMSPITDPFCGADWKYDDGGRWPWNVDGGYNHIFEDQAWVDDSTQERTVE